MVKFISILPISLVAALPSNGPISRQRATGGQISGYTQEDNGRYFLEEPNFSYWMDTKDDILSEFKNYMAMAEKRLGSSLVQSDQDKSLKTLQRFAELVDMIMYLQKVPFFGQYWYYGCWCAPEGFFNTARQGYGKPVDAIDRSCRSMSYCYECAQLDHGAECNTEEVSYRWHGTINSEGKKVIVCDDDPTDKKSQCAHSLCSCDKNLAEELAIHEDKWNLHHHHKWGEFNRDACFVSEEGAQINVQHNTDNGSNTVTAFENEESIQQRAFGEIDGDLGRIPAIQLKFASTFANPEEKYCCGEYGNLENQRKPLKKHNNAGALHNERCCWASDANGFTGIPYNHGSQTCDELTGAVSDFGRM